MTTMSPLAASVVAPRRRSRRSSDLIGWVFVGPFLVIFALVLVAPVAYSIYLSLFQETLVGGNRFVGVANYVALFQDPKFWESLARVAFYLCFQVPIMLLIALLCALAVDSVRLYGRNFFRITIFVPYAVPGVVATFMWGFIFGDRFGLVGWLRDATGLNIPSPLNPSYLLPAIGNIQVWEFVGYNMLIFYSALRAVPAELYEAAEIDGANGWRIIRYVKLPAIRGAIVIATVFSVIGAFQLFNEPQIISTLVPNSVSSYYTPNIYAYNLSFAGQQYNYSATVAIVVGIITAVLAAVTQHVGNRREGAN